MPPALLPPVVPVTLPPCPAEPVRPPTEAPPVSLRPPVLPPSGRWLLEDVAEEPPTGPVVPEESPALLAELAPPEVDDPALLLELEPAPPPLWLDERPAPPEPPAGWVPSPEPLEQPSMARPMMVASNGLVESSPDLIGAVLQREESKMATWQPLGRGKLVQLWNDNEELLGLAGWGYAARMAKTKRRSFGKFLRGAVKDVVMPTSVGLGLALAGCGSSDSKAQDGSVRTDLSTDLSVVQPDAQIRLDTQMVYAVMPAPKDAAPADTRPDTRVDTFIPPRDAAADRGDARRDTPLYAIMPARRDAGDDAIAPDAEFAKPDAKPDSKVLPKDTGPIFAIMPLAVLPPSRG